VIYAHFVMALPPLVVGLATAIGGLASAAGTIASIANKPKTPAAPGIPPTPAPVQQPTGTPNQLVPQTAPSFLAAASTPQAGQTAQKSLLGQ
jgi:hypothetical protein